ncbi:MAG TPA: bifunctional folylpolyglutamate synthase/dihydrofolate synthase, partial [Methyloversatilis sp.]
MRRIARIAGDIEHAEHAAARIEDGLTLAAFEIFTLEGVSARVWETGLGGRLDATNTQTPTATVLTLIELEHTDILGDTRTLIAGEKAGILKPGVPAFVA